MNLKRFSILKHSWFETLWIMLAAFLCYTGMYAVRKSFLAGQYLDLDLGFRIDPKTVLVISQVLGYMLSKFIGIKLISEMGKEKRAVWLIALVSLGLLMLLAFGMLPSKLKIIALFLNGLPLGMVFGVVLSYLEGRRNTELLTAGLSATFIFSTGFVKTVGVVIMQDYGVSEQLMPFFTGLLFFPLFLISVWMLSRSKMPDELDTLERTERRPMDRAQRKDFLNKHGIGYIGLVLIYILLTVVRDFRDNFIVEFWAELGYAKEPSLITLTEIPVAVIVLIIAALGIIIRKNLLAFNMGLLMTFLGGLTMMVCTLLFQHEHISPIFWIISTGVGVYLPYILFHCLVFERLLAFLKYKGNIGFLFYIADALGYLASVLVLFFKEFFNYTGTWVGFFVEINLLTAILILLAVILTFFYFNSKKSKWKIPTIKHQSNYSPLK